jgi:hypothetical protein
MRELLYIPGGRIIRFTDRRPFDTSFEDRLVELSLMKHQITSEYGFLLAIVCGELSPDFYEMHDIKLPALLDEFEVINLPDPPESTEHEES